MGTAESKRELQREQRCVDRLKQARKNGDSDKEVNSLQDLGDVHMDKAKVRRHGWDFTRASALYNAALVRCKEPQVRETLIHRVKYTEKLFIKRVAKVNKHDAAMYDYQTDLNHKAELTRIRDMCWERLLSIATMCDYSKNPVEDVVARESEWGRAEAVRELYMNITREMKGFTTSLVEECFSVLGRPPCKYAMIGMGSIARQEMTPYSDLEFAILVEEGKGTEENKTYFRILTHLLHLKVLNLGETILPSMAIPYLNDFENHEHNWLYDSVTPRGFSFDGAMPWASKTPLGRKKTKRKAALELIMTPREMAELQTEERSVKEGYRLADVLSKVDLITGDGDILAIYDELVSQKLDEEIPNSCQMTVRRNRALASCHTIMNNFDLEKTVPKSGELYEVKQVVYRFLSMCFRDIGDLCGTAGKTLTDIIEELQKGGILPSLAAHNVRVAAAIADEIRLRTYCTYGKQREHMSIVKPLHSSRPAMGGAETTKAGSTSEHTCTESKVVEKQHKYVAKSSTEASLSPHHVYHIDDSNLLHRFYMTVLPLQSLLRDKLLVQSSNSELDPRVDGELIRDVFMCQSLYGGALERGKASSILQLYERAEECLRNALQEDPNNDGLVIELSEVLLHLQKFHDFQQLLHPVLERMKQSPENVRGNHAGAAAQAQRFREVQETMSLFRNSARRHGDVKQWIKRYFLAQVSASDVSNLYQATVYSKVADFFAGFEDKEQSELYLRRALENLDSEPSPGGRILHKLKRADALANIASAYQRLMAPPAQIIKYAQLAREAYIECVGADTPHFGLMRCMVILGKANKRLKEWKEVIEWFEQVMEMVSALDERQGDTFTAISRLSEAYLQMGEKQKALGLFEQAESLLPDTCTWDDDSGPVALDTIHAYGSALVEVERVAEARQRFQRILDLPDRGRAYEVTAKAKASYSLGEMFLKTKQFDTAIEYMKQSYSLYVDMFKNDNGNVNVKALEGAIMATMIKGTMEQQLGKVGVALQSFNAVLELLDSTGIDIRHAFPNESEWITRHKLFALTLKGYCLFLMSDVQGATAAYTEAVDTFRDFYGADAHHPVLAFLLTAKGRLHGTQGDSKAAKKCYNEVWEMITRGQPARQSGYETILFEVFSFGYNTKESNSPNGMAETRRHLSMMIRLHQSFFSGS